MSKKGSYCKNAQEKNESFMRTKRYLDTIRIQNQNNDEYGPF